MGKWKGKLAKRIMALVLSGAMIMSNMSAYAAELASETSTEISTEVSEDRESEAKETIIAESEEAVQSESSASENISESSEQKNEETTEADSTEKATESDSTETEASTVEKTTSIEASSTEETTKVGTTEEETTEEETAEVDTTEEETTKVEEENKEGEQNDAPKHTFDATTIPPGDAADKTAIKVGTTFADGYFSVEGTVTMRIKNGKVTSVEVDKDQKGAIVFEVTGTADVEIEMSSTGDGNKSEIGLVDSSGKVVPNNENVTDATGTDHVKMTYTGLSAGKYKAVSPTTDATDKNRGARLYSIKVTDVATGATTTTHTYDSTTIPSGDAADKTAIKVGTTFADGYFSVEGTVTMRIKNGKVTSVEVDKDQKGAIVFEVTGTADVEIEMSSTGDGNKSEIGLVDSSGKVVPNNENITDATGTDHVKMTYTGLSAGKYKAVSPTTDATDKNRGARLYTIKVIETTEGARPTRVDWASVANPEIGKPVINEKDSNKVDVPVTMVIGSKGADSVTVSAYLESDTEAKDAKAEETITEADTENKAIATLTLKDSGKYYFKAVAKRNKYEETDTKKEPTSSANSELFDFVLPFKTAPVINNITSLGQQDDGKVKVSLDWSEVKEATGYTVTYWERQGEETKTETANREHPDAVKVDVNSETLKTDLSLDAGKYYFITVTATRTLGEGDPDTAESEIGYIYTLAKALDIYTIESKDFEKFAAGDKPDGTVESGGTNNYFEIAWNAKSKLDTSNKTWPDGYTSDTAKGGNGHRFNFGGTINASENQNYIKFTSKDQSVVKVWWACGGAGRGITIEKLGEDGKTSEVVTPAIGTVANNPYIATFSLEEGGTYYVGNTVGNNYIFRVTVEEGEHAQEIRERWDTVTAPEVKKVEQKNVEDKDTAAKVGQLDVTVAIEMGTDGADAVYVDMYDSKNTLIDRKESMTSGVSEVTLSFKPKATGQYYFRSGAYRIGEEDFEKISEKSGPYDFTYLLTTPAISSVTNHGAKADNAQYGEVEVEWGSVDEATAYVLKIYDRVPEGEEKVDPIQTIEAGGKTIWDVTDGLEVGKTYYFAVTALRPETPGADYETSKESERFKKEITAETQTKWSFAAYGSSTSITSKVTKNVDSESGKKGDSVPANGSYAEFDGTSQGFVEVWSLGGKGKVVPNTTDGLAFYYTEIDPAKTDKTNFTLTATAHVNEWKISNGQDGFGLMASDAVGKNGNGDAFWTNSYQALVSKIEYRWDPSTGMVADSGDITKPRYSMKLGVGATEKKGATAKDVESIMAGELSQPGDWQTSTVTLDSSVTKYAAGTYNIVGNFTDSEPEGTVAGDLLLTDFKLTLQKNNTGYFLTYENVKTGESMTQKYYDTEALNHISDKVYVGFFASRNADVTFSNISFTTISPEDDDPAEEQPISEVTLSRSVLSGATTNTSDYDFVFTSNWSGTLTIKDKEGKTLANTNVTGSLDPELSKLKDSDDRKSTKETVTLSGLSIGQNVFTITYTPDKEWQPDEFTILNSYDPVTFTHTVDFKKYGADGSNIYVAPKGKASATGTKADPLDIYTAVKYVQPGQKIVLKGGEYSLYKTITIERGINGTEDKMIYMVADTDAIGANRPVFYFNQACAGMIIAGNYWYFKGFDVTMSADASDGIKVSGSHNTLDQINAYKNGNTGIQISRYKGTDTWRDWPSYNTILNCTSYLNSDKGYEDADGFAAKLTIGSGNVFDGCIAAYNADDGWDLFAKIESGNIGAVTIQNSVAYMNGYVLKDADGNLSLEGTLVNAGNGNGFKMGGDALQGGSEYEDPPYSGHKLKNSVAFFNKSKGFDSNSCPNNKISDSVSFDNEGPNISLYTYTNVKNTEYETTNVISYRTKYKGVVDDISGKVNGETILQTNATTYQWDNITKKSINSDKKSVETSWFKENAFNFSVFESPDKYTEPQNGIIVGRNPDGTVNMNGFLELSEKAGQGSIGGSSSDNENTVVDPDKDTDGSISSGSNTGNDAADDEESIALESALKDPHQINGVVILQVGNELLKDENGHYETTEDGKFTVLNKKISVPYTGTAVKPEIAVYINGARYTNYSVSYKNNTMAYVAGDEAYASIPETKRPTITIKMKGSYEGDAIAYFDITPVDLSDSTLISAPSIAVDKSQVPKTTLIFNGKTLSNKKDYTITKTITKTSETNPDTGEVTEKETESSYSGGSLDKDCILIAEAVAGSNYTGSVRIPYRIVESDKLLSKAKLKLDATSFMYTGEEIKAAVKLDGTDVATLKTKISAEDETEYPLYTVSYANAKQVGRATVTVTATQYNADYAGSKTLSFTIKKAPIKKTDVYIGGNPITTLSEKVYTASAQTQGIPAVKITDPGNSVTTTMRGVQKGSVYTNQVDKDGLYVYNYTYEYKNNTEAGTAQLIVKGIHNCSGSAAFSFKILPETSATVEPHKKIGEDGKPYKLKGNKDNKLVEVVYDGNVVYTPTGAKPSVSVYYMGNGVSAKNYSITYKNNRDAGQDTATMDITWRGGLKLSKTTNIPYSIDKRDIAAGSLTVKSVYDVFTNGKETIKKSDLEKSRAVIMADTAKLSNNRDYTLVYEWPEYDGQSQKFVKEKDDNGNDLNQLKMVTYDAATDKSNKADEIEVPKAGLPVTVYIKTAKNGNYEISDLDTVDENGQPIKVKRDKIKIGEFRVAWFDIAKATVKLSTDGKDKVVLYYKDTTENPNANNRLDSNNLYVYHSAYATYAASKDKLNWVSYANKGRSADVMDADENPTVKDGYTYNLITSDASGAGNQKVVLYGTGIFGGSKVFNYKLMNKTYNISRALVEKDITITIPASLDAYWQREASAAAIEEAENAIKEEAKTQAKAAATAKAKEEEENIIKKAKEAAAAKNPDEHSVEYKVVYKATYNAEYSKVYDEEYDKTYKTAYDAEKAKNYDMLYDVAYAAAYKAAMKNDIDAAEAAAKEALFGNPENAVTEADYTAYLISAEGTADTAAKAAGETAKASDAAVKKAAEAAKKVSEDTESAAYKDAYEAVLNGEYDNAYTKSYAEAYCKARKDDKTYGGEAFTAEYNQLYSDARDVVIREGLRGKITVNGTALITDYLGFDNTKFVNGKCNVEITGIGTYFGSKKITVTVN